MAIAKRAPIYAFRNDPLHETFSVIGYDLTGADLAFAVRAYPDQAGDALISITAADLVVDPVPTGDEGIRLISAEADDDGVMISIVELIADKETVQALDPAAEAGGDLKLYFDLQWTLAAEESDPFAATEDTILYGDFIVRGSANG